MDECNHCNFLRGTTHRCIVFHASIKQRICINSLVDRIRDSNQLFDYCRILFKSSDLSLYLFLCYSNHTYIKITFSKHIYISRRYNDGSIDENRWPPASSSGWSTTKPGMVGFRVDCRTLPMAVMTRGAEDDIINCSTMPAACRHTRGALPLLMLVDRPATTEISLSGFL